MALRTPKSLIDTFEQESDRLIDYFNLKAISVSQNPYQEFLNQFTTIFGRDKGLNLFPYVQGRYNLLNTLFKNEQLQKILPKKFKGPLRRSENSAFWNRE